MCHLCAQQLNTFPFDMTNAPGTFQTLMYQVIRLLVRIGQIVSGWMLETWHLMFIRSQSKFVWTGYGSMFLHIFQVGLWFVIYILCIKIYFNFTGIENVISFNVFFCIALVFGKRQIDAVFEKRKETLPVNELSTYKQVRTFIAWGHFIPL